MVIDYLMILFIFVPFMAFWRRRLFRTLVAAPAPKPPSPAASAASAAPAPKAPSPAPPTSAAGRAWHWARRGLRMLLLPPRLLFAPAPNPNPLTLSF